MVDLVALKAALSIINLMTNQTVTECNKLIDFGNEKEKECEELKEKNKILSEELYKLKEEHKKKDCDPVSK